MSEGSDARSPRGPSDDSVSLVVPVFNEVERFDEHAAELAQWVASCGAGSELIVVDDGSTDGTPDLVERRLGSLGAAQARLIRRPHEGKGAAVRAGLLEATAPTAAFCDVDLATPLDDLAQLVKHAVRIGGLVIGSREAPGSQLLEREHRLREELGRCYNRLLRVAVVRGIADTQCGAKAAPTAVWRRILEHSGEDGFAWDAEIVAIAQRLGIRVHEHPVVWSHDRRTRVRPVRDGVAMVAAVPRIARRLRRVPRHPGP